jgi:type II secretion system protein N
MKHWSPLLLIAAGVVSLVLLLLLTIIFIPVGEIKGVVERGLAREGYVLQVAEFKKTFPLGITVSNALVSDERGVLLKLDSATFRVQLLPLFIGKVAFEAQARIGEGELSANIQPRTSTISVHAERVRLQDVPLLQIATGANIRGDLFLDGSFTGEGTALQGEMRMEIGQADLRSIKISGMPFPDASYETIRGMFKASGGIGNLESLTFQGDGIYIRLKGTLGMTGPLDSAPLNLTIELMPKPDFLEKQKLIFLLLAKYMKSPGSYRIPVTGTVTNPAIH